MGRPVKRRYDASRRRAAAEVTRERICAAAEKLFLRDGYARTSIRAVAGEADVAEATVYIAFSTKEALLDATIVRATRDNDGEPLSAILDVPAPDMLGRLAVSHAATMHRAARLIALGESASLMDAALRPLRDRAHANLRAAYTAIAKRLADARLLRPDLTPADAADTLYAICNETTYLRLTDNGTRALKRYPAWLAATLGATLLGDSQPVR
jgi:AcrR family transcriptional regulator